MPNQTDTRDWTFRLRVDQQSTQQSSQAVQRLQERIAGLRAETRRLRVDSVALSKELRTLDDAAEIPSVQRTVERARNLRSELAASRTQLQATKEAADEYNTVLERSATVMARVEAEQRRNKDTQQRAAAYRGAAYSLGNINSVASLVSPELAYPANVISDLMQAAGGVGDLSRRLPELGRHLGLTTGDIGALTVALGATAAAVVVAKTVFDDLSASANAVQAKVQGQIGALKDYNAFIQTATTEDVQKRIEAVNEDRRANAAYLEDLYALKEEVLQASGAGGDVTERLTYGALRTLNTLGLLGYGLDDIDKAITDTDKAIQGDRAMFGLLAQAITDGTTAKADAAAREKEYTVRLVDAYQRRAQLQIDMENLVKSASSDQVRSRLGDIETERSAYENLKRELEPLAGTSDEAATALDDVRDKLFVLGEEASVVSGVLEKIKSREQSSRTIAGPSVLSSRVGSVFGTPYGGPQGALLQAAVEAQTEREKTLADQIELTNQYLDDQATTEAKRALTLERDQEDADRKRAKDIAAHYADLAQLDATYYAKVGDQLERMAEDAADADKQQVEELQAYAKESERQAKDHRRRMLDIEQSLNRGVEGAVEDRSVSAAIEAVRQAKQQAEDENDQYDEERQRRDEDFKDRLDELRDQRAERLRDGQQALSDLKQQHSQERTQRVQDFWQRLRDEDQERAIKRQRQQQDWVSEDLARWNHYLAQQTKTATHWRILQSLTETGMQGVETTIQTRWNAIQSAMSSSGQPQPPPLHGLHSFGTGGTPPLGQKVVVGDGGPEVAQFNRDGSWHIFNNRQSRQIVAGQPITVQLNIPMQTALDSRSIEAVFEQRVLPKLTSAVVQAQRQAGVR